MLETQDKPQAPKENNFIESSDYPFDYSFENSIPFQEGPYVVVANILNSKTGEYTGGGLVACFATFPDANNCFEEIMDTNPKHEPEIHRMNWKLGKSEPVRIPEETVFQARKNAKIALKKQQQNLKR